MTLLPETLALRAAAQLLELQSNRILVALAGPPGAGKTTLATLLRNRLIAEGQTAVVVPMDGFHFDDRILAKRGLMSRKGAPDTFDAHGFHWLVARAAKAEQDIAYPVFDRENEVSYAGAGIISKDVRFVLFEGNYLLLEDEPWNQLHQYWSFSLRVDVPRQELETRLMNRWLSIGLTAEDAEAKVYQNDLKNADIVRLRSKPADLVLMDDT